MRRLWFRRSMIMLSVILLGWCVISLIVAYRLTHRLRPRFEEQVPRLARGVFENHRLKTSDGEEIGAWFIDGCDDSPSVLVLHGNGGSRMSSLSRANIFTSIGFAVLLISLALMVTQLAITMISALARVMMYVRQFVS